MDSTPDLLIQRPYCRNNSQSLYFHKPIFSTKKVCRTTFDALKSRIMSFTRVLLHTLLVFKFELAFYVVWCSKIMISYNFEKILSFYSYYVIKWLICNNFPFCYEKVVEVCYNDIISKTMLQVSSKAGYFTGKPTFTDFLNQTYKKT